jgi:hypothetical protein
VFATRGVAPRVKLVIRCCGRGGNDISFGGGYGRSRQLELKELSVMVCAHLRKLGQVSPDASRDKIHEGLSLRLLHNQVVDRLVAGTAAIPGRLVLVGIFFLSLLVGIDDRHFEVMDDSPGIYGHLCEGT